MKTVRKILLSLGITEKIICNYGYEKHRLNPYNPLSYILIILVCVVGIILYGVIGFWKEIDLRNPFKYQ